MGVHKLQKENQKNDVLTTGATSSVLPPCQLPRARWPGSFTSSGPAEQPPQRPPLPGQPPRQPPPPEQPPQRPPPPGPPPRQPPPPERPPRRPPSPERPPRHPPPPPQRPPPHRPH